MSGYLDEDAVEQYAIDLLKGRGYAYLHGPDIAPGGTHQERSIIQRCRLGRAAPIRSWRASIRVFRHQLSAMRCVRSQFTIRPISS